MTHLTSSSHPTNGINIGDLYTNTQASGRARFGVRIADEETLSRIRFAKAVNWGTCFYVPLHAYLKDKFNEYPLIY